MNNHVETNHPALELSQTRMEPAHSATSKSSEVSGDNTIPVDSQSAVSSAPPDVPTPTSNAVDGQITINIGDVTGIPDFKPRTQQHTRPYMHGELYRIQPQDEFQQEWRITTRLRKVFNALFPSPQQFPYSLESPSSFLRKIQQRPLFAPMDMNNVPMALWSLFGAFIAISLVGMLHEYCLETRDFPMLYAAYGAASSLLFTKPHLPFIQPYNILGGTLVPTFIAVSVEKIAGNVSDVHLWFPAALSVSLSLFVMELLHCQHPPGGALALFYIANPSLHSLGYKYVPASLLGASIVFLVGIVVNNLQKVRHYPEYWMPKWWGDKPSSRKP